MGKVFAVLFALWASSAGAERVVVFAAASLKGPLEEAVESYPGEVVIAYGASSALARQIGAGAPADLFLSANETWARAVPGEGVWLLSNRLVLIGPAGADALPLEPEAVIARLGTGRLAMAFSTSVPAGIYGREALESLGLWSVVAPQVAETAHVRAALALVVRGEAPLGLVYASDAGAEPRVTVVADLPLDSHSTIKYSGVALTPAGEGLLDHLRVTKAPFLAVGFLAP